MDYRDRLPGVGRLESIETAFAGIGMAILLFAVFVDVLFREVFSQPILWLAEVSMFSFLWMIFIGAAVAVRRNSHYRIEILVQAIKSPRVHSALGWFVLAVSLAFGIILAYQGVSFAELGIKRVSRPSGFPLVFVFAAVPISGLSMCYFLVNRVLRRAAGIPEANPVEEETQIG